MNELSEIGSNIYVFFFIFDDTTGRMTWNIYLLFSRHHMMTSFYWMARYQLSGYWLLEVREVLTRESTLPASPASPESRDTNIKVIGLQPLQGRNAEAVYKSLF